MATYYVRIGGNDSNAGTSAGAAWRTLSKAFTTVSAGDVVYIGAGTYREALTISTAWASETRFVGDYTGQYTGDAGIVYWSSYTNGDRARGATRPLTTSGTPRFWTFENLVIGGGTSGLSVSATIRDFKFTRCTFLPPAQGMSNFPVALTATADVDNATTIDGCVFFGAILNVILPTSTSADYDANIVVKNCQFVGCSASVNASGANSFKGGGVDFINNFIWTGSTNSPIRTASANLSTSIPCTAYNNTLIGITVTGINANTSGQIIENYNQIIAATPRSNVTAGVNSTTDSCPQMLLGGYEWLYGLPARPFGMPMLGSPFAYMGGTSVPSTDILGRTRTGNGAQWIDSGTATAGGVKTITDSGKTWGIDSLIGCMVVIVSGTGSGQRKIVDTNTATVITVFENWQTQPDNTSVYRIIRGPQAFTGQATAGTSTTLTVSSAAWDTNQWAGYTLEITSGTGSGQTTTVTSNTGTVLTVPTLTTAPDATSVFSVYRQTGVDALLPAVGCFEAAWDGQRASTPIHAGSGNSLQITGPGYHEFQYPVDASSTTVSVWGRYDSRHGSTNKPQMKIFGGGECGVSDTTVTMTAAVDTWEELTTTFTPTSAGIVTVGVYSRADYPDGNAFFDN